MAAVEIRNEITFEHVPFDATTNLLGEIAVEVRDTFGDDTVTDAQVVKQVETILLDKIRNGDKAAIFQLGFLYFHQGQFNKAVSYFEKAKDYDYQSLFMYGVMKYDGLGTEVNMKEGMECMLTISESESRLASHLLPAARYNLGRAYYQGFGEYQSDKDAEKWFLLAADDGNPRASVKAQSVLGMFYSRQDSDYKDLKKAFFWHSEACGNGSLESQGALGVMYMLGLGVKKDTDAAYVCLKEAANRGNVYAMGNLVILYYRSKLFTKACSLGYKFPVDVSQSLEKWTSAQNSNTGDPRKYVQMYKEFFNKQNHLHKIQQSQLQTKNLRRKTAPQVSQLTEVDVPLLASETDCLPLYISKGIAMACFIYARCLAAGHSVKPDKDLAKEFYSKCYKFDPDICALLQYTVQQGAI